MTPCHRVIKRRISLSITPSNLHEKLRVERCALSVSFEKKWLGRSICEATNFCRAETRPSGKFPPSKDGAQKFRQGLWDKAHSMVLKKRDLFSMPLASASG
ncbi:MAG: hypothetical protein RMK89_01455 [Armatimonadota bacterium]|nr:hypothetical protein [Armatimonadota bacterium]MDW8142105.1 hypothetical protein [Armatimonadota bacterium]